MLYRIAADGLVLFHLAFIVFVVFGGLLVLKWQRLMVWHLPAAVWGVAVEVFHLPCPLTHWENLHAPGGRAKRLRRRLYRTLRVADHLPGRIDTGHSDWTGQRGTGGERAGLSSIDLAQETAAAMVTVQHEGSAHAVD